MGQIVGTFCNKCRQPVCICGKNEREFTKALYDILLHTEAGISVLKTMCKKHQFDLAVESCDDLLTKIDNFKKGKY